jgi:rod shape-determining protein MreD
MNKIFSYVFLVILSIFGILLQTTLLSPIHFGIYSPDLNLILIVIIALLCGLKEGTILTIGNGYIMDVLSGNLLGVNTLSRLSVFAIVHSITDNVYINRTPSLALAFFFSTVFSWGFMWVVIKINPSAFFGFSLLDILKQGFVNTMLGIPLFFIIKKYYERVQK